MTNKKSKTPAKKRQATGTAATSATCKPAPNGTSNREEAKKNTIAADFCAIQASGSGSNTTLPQTPLSPTASSLTPLQTMSPPTTPSPASEPQDSLAMAEKIKEEGNVAFKAAKYQSAVDLYTKAIGKRHRNYKADFPFLNICVCVLLSFFF